MKTCQVAIFHAKDQPFTYETVPVPGLRDGEILVRNEYTTLCRSDLNTFTGKRIEKTPTILGHEVVGVIEEMAPGAPARDYRGADLRVGDRVTWAIYASNPDSWMSLIGLLGIGGIAVFIGATFPQRPLQINAEQLVRNIHTIKGLHNYNGQDLVAAVEFMEQNHRRFPFEGLVHDRFDLDEVNEAFDYGVKSRAHRVGIRVCRGP
jgi:D-arabinose 1-dehydrogenase-like Zn-dependent alcohol dehydrogenase